MPDYHLQNRFTYHPPTTPDTAAAHATVREWGLEMSNALTQMVSVSGARELALALTKIEEAVFWANAGIARYGPKPPEQSTVLTATNTQAMDPGRDRHGFA